MPPAPSTSAKPWWWRTATCSRSRRRKGPIACWRASPNCAPADGSARPRDAACWSRPPSPARSGVPIRRRSARSPSKASPARNSPGSPWWPAARSSPSPSVSARWPTAPGCSCSGCTMTPRSRDVPAAQPPWDIFLVAGEASGDRLGAALIRALRGRTGGTARFAGVGGPEMAAEGVASLFPIDDLSIIGFSAIPSRLPKILRLIGVTAAAVVARRPQVLVIIDSPAFSCRVAKRVRATDPTIAIVEYVSPSVWAWRPSRAPALRGYVDHILALLPFEPEVHQRLGGPPCSYVGHPLADEVDELRPNAAEARRRLVAPPVLLVLPGSRRGERQGALGRFPPAGTVIAP